MDSETLKEIRKIKATINRIAEHEGQDSGLVIQMAEEMLNDLEIHGSVVELSYYIKRYCDVLDNPDSDSADLAREIELMLAAVEDLES